MVWATIILVFGGLALKVYWDWGRTESDKRKAYIRDLEHRGRLIDAGINPDTLQAYGRDRSHDLCNANHPCPDCPKIQEKNEARNRAAWRKFQRAS